MINEYNRKQCTKIVDPLWLNYYLSEKIKFKCDRSRKIGLRRHRDRLSPKGFHTNRFFTMALNYKTKFL